MKKFIIIGGGLVGPLMASLLRKLGHSVTIIEKRANPLNYSNEERRSVNLALSHRGWQALELAGLKEIVKSHAIPMYGRIIHRLDQRTKFQPYDIHHNAIHSISRERLNEILVKEALKNGVDCKFSSTCKEIDLDKNEIILTRTDKEETISYDYLIGADGVYSTVRKKIDHQINQKSDISTISHGYIELEITASKATLDFQGLHIWPRKNFMLIALPNKDGSFTCTLFLPFTGSVFSFEALNTTEKIKNFLKVQFFDISESISMEQAIQRFQNPFPLGYLEANQWLYQNLLLIGDGAHGIVPFYGQGMNAGFEDCQILFTALNEGRSINDVFGEFSQKRKKDTSAIMRMALTNFEEMRDKVAEDTFLLKKNIDGLLHEHYPDLWTPTYSKVSFSSVPYSEIEGQEMIQNKILDKILFLINQDDFDPEVIKSNRIQSLLETNLI